MDCLAETPFAWRSIDPKYDRKRRRHTDETARPKFSFATIAPHALS
jgi:hypothetical protein